MPYFLLHCSNYPELIHSVYTKADSQFVRPEVIITDFSMKETVTRRIRFRVRQGHFKKGQMVLTCKAKIEPNMYDASADIIILEKYNTDMSDGERSNGESRDNDNRSGITSFGL